MVTKSCYNPLVVDLVEGKLMTTSDAIESDSPQILDLQTLEMEPSSQLTPVEECATGACNASSCPNGREIAMLSMITDVTLSFANPARIVVDLNDAIYTNNETADVAAYEVDYGDGGAVDVITIGVQVNRSVAAFPDGFYYGTITETVSGAVFEFWYRVGAGLVVAAQTQRTTSVDVDIACASYPDYTISMTDLVNVTDPSHSITQLGGAILANEVYSESYGAGTYSVTETGTLITDLETAPANDLIKSEYTADAVGDIANTGIFRTQCIVA